MTSSRYLVDGFDEQCVVPLVSKGISVEENTAFCSATDSCKCRILEGSLLYTRSATLVADLGSHKVLADLTLSMCRRVVVGPMSIKRIKGNHALSRTGDRQAVSNGKEEKARRSWPREVLNGEKKVVQSLRQ